MANHQLYIPGLLLLFLFASCSGSGGSGDSSNIQSLMKADRSMSDLASRNGFFSALSAYADKDFVKMGEGTFPIVGKKEFDKTYKDKPGPKTISWEPVDGKVAESGELGYTWGKWKFVLPDTVHYGIYITVWHKDQNGNWKMLFDGGGGTPPPEN